MIVPGSANPLLMVQSGDPLDELGKIERSVRFRSAAAASFTRTFGAPTNSKKWTFNTWVKKSKLAAYQGFFDSYINGSNFTSLMFDTSDRYWFVNTISGSTASQSLSNALYRDPGSHANFHIIFDSDNAIAADRCILFVNGDRIPITGSTPLGQVSYMNQSGYLHSVGRRVDGNYNLDGFMSYAAFVDGQALPPTAFGQFHPRTGQWRPKTKAAIRSAVASGGVVRNGWGGNGSFLPFDDPTSLTTLGYDRSQSDTDTTGNNWTATNISLTAGATYDSMLDTPTNSHCIINPLPPYLNSGMYFIDSGLGVSGYADATASNLIGTHELTEKIYFEVKASANNGYGQSSIGVCNASKSITAIKWLGSGGDYSAYGTYGLAFDRASGKIWIKTPAGAWAGGGDPVTGTLPTATISLGSDPAFPVVGIGRSSGSSNVGSSYLNAGQRPFVHAPPAEFKAICTKNLKYDSAATVAVSGSFSGNVSANGPTVFMNGCPETLTINGNPVTFGTHADRLASGFKVRSASASYNASGTNTWTATILAPSIKSLFRFQNAKGN